YRPYRKQEPKRISRCVIFTNSFTLTKQSFRPNTKKKGKTLTVYTMPLLKDTATSTVPIISSSLKRIVPVRKFLIWNVLFGVLYTKPIYSADLLAFLP